ncbi:MAG TPA: hypothetical protein VMH05_16830 [Bryobacteraceae bacterium]|nr:hypothetical protein [Bryobacteraceae bacterium]
MARIRGLEAGETNPLTRFLYWMTKRKLGRVIEAVKITAHQPRLVLASGQMEMGQQAVHSVEPKLKALAEIKAALMIGCPF